MVNQQVLEGRWNEIRGQLKSRWGELNDDELQRAHGDVDQLVGLIQRQTGESREQVEQYLEEITSSGGTMGHATEQARHYGQQATEQARYYSAQAAEALRMRSEQMSERMRQGYSGAEAMVQQRPAESLAVAFGAGVIAGVVLGLLLRSSD